MNSQSPKAVNWGSRTRWGVDWVFGKRHCDVLIAEVEASLDELTRNVNPSEVSQQLYSQRVGGQRRRCLLNNYIPSSASSGACGMLNLCLADGVRLRLCSRKRNFRP
jgi:hypothetical protein